MNNVNIEELEKKLNYTFNDKKLIILAMTHSSYANEHKMSKLQCNERLEFLGDAVLDLVISKYIYNHFSEMPEGELTKLRAGLVCEGMISKKATELGFGEHLLLGKGEEATGGRQRESVLADSFESVIGAIYLDGGMDNVENYIMSIMLSEIEVMKKSFRNIDCKTRLQEILQKFSKEPIHYIITGESGPDHNKVFEACVMHEDKVLGRGKGKSKKEAEQEAANDAISKMND